LPRPSLPGRHSNPGNMYRCRGGYQYAHPHFGPESADLHLRTRASHPPPQQQASLHCRLCCQLGKSLNTNACAFWATPSLIAENNGVSCRCTQAVKGRKNWLLYRSRRRGGSWVRKVLGCVRGGICESCVYVYAGDGGMPPLANKKNAFF